MPNPSHTPPGQVCDLWCFGSDTAGADGLLRTTMSMPHTHDALMRHTLAPGDSLLTGQRKPILTFLEDSGPGAHDSTVPACSLELYQSMLGVEEHDSCTTNLHNSLHAIGCKLTDTPSDFLTCVLCAACLHCRHSHPMSSGLHPSTCG